MILPPKNVIKKFAFLFVLTVDGENSTDTETDTKRSNNENQIRSTALEWSVILILQGSSGTGFNGIPTSPSAAEVVQNIKLLGLHCESPTSQ